MRYALLLGLTITLAFLSLSAGRSFMPPDALWQALSAGPEGSGRMIWQLRLPRLIAGLLIGGAFGLAGMVLQSLLRNELASPDVIGLTQCAAFGAVLAMMTGIPVFLGAWAGGLVAIALLAWLASQPGAGVETRAVVLQGLGLAIISGALTEMLILRAGDGSAGMAMTWLTGSLNGLGWPEVRRALWLLPLMGLLFCAARRLDRLELGEDLARALGLRVGLSRITLGLMAALLVAGAVSLSGPLAFVALAAGPVARWCAGGRPDPFAAFLIGAGFVTFADMLSRSIAPAALLPAGLYTALIGAPVLIFAVRRQTRR